MAAKSEDIGDTTSEDESVQDDQEEAGFDRNCGKSFKKAKKKIMNNLVLTLKKIKGSEDVKNTDLETYNAMKEYRKSFINLRSVVNSKIIDYIQQFFKLYGVVVAIMETINPDLKVKMEEIFNDFENVETGDGHYKNILKYLSKEYMTDNKVNELYTIVGKNFKTGKSLKAVQRQTIKDLSLLTNGLIRDVDSMQCTVVYILMEIKKGVAALHNLRNKGNVTGIRYLFNFYTGSCDLAQLLRLIRLINALNIEGILQVEMEEFFASNDAFDYKMLVKYVIQKISSETKLKTQELKTYSSTRDVHKSASICIVSFNKIIEYYKSSTIKIVKQTVIRFMRILEEVIIIIKRRNIRNSEQLEEIIDNETSDLSTESALMTKYLSGSGRTKTNIALECGINFDDGRNTETVERARQLYTRDIQQMKQTIIGEITELDEEIHHYMDSIVDEMQDLHRLRENMRENAQYQVEIEIFDKLTKIMKLANTLGISHGDITNTLAGSESASSSNRELEKYFENAVKRLRTVKSNCEQQLQSYAETAHIKTEVQKTSSYLEEIVSDTVSEMRSDIREYITQYNEALETLLQRNDVNSNANANAKLIQENNINMEITLSEHLQNYILDRYSKSELRNFKSSVETTTVDVEQLKNSVIDSLQLTTKNLEDGIESAKSEAMKSIFSILSKATNDIVEVTENSAATLDNNQLESIAMAQTSITLLEDIMRVDIGNAMEEAHNALQTAKESLSEQYDYANERVTTQTMDEYQIRSELRNTVQAFECTFNTMRQVVKVKFEQSSANFNEVVKKVTSNLEDNAPLNTILQGIMSQPQTYSFDSYSESYQKFLSIVQSDCYKSASSVTSMYEIIQTSNTEIIANSDQCLRNIDSLNADILRTFDGIEETINFVSLIYSESTVIIESIEEGYTVELTQDEISTLATAFALSQTISQIQNTADFSNAQKMINQELEETLQVLKTSSVDSESRLQRIDKCVKKYDVINNNLRDEVSQKFLKSASEYTSAYELVFQQVKTRKNTQMLRILEQISSSTTDDADVSEQCRSFQTYSQSEQFVSSVFCQDLYESTKQSQLASDHSTVVEEITQRVKENILQMDEYSTYLRQNFIEGRRILQDIKNGKTSLTVDERVTITECALLAQSLFHQDSHSVHSIDKKTSELYIRTKSRIDEQHEEIHSRLQSINDHHQSTSILNNGVLQYEEIYQNMRDEVEESLVHHSNDLIATYEATLDILETSNPQIRSSIRDIRNDMTTARISENYMKIEEFFKSVEFDSQTTISDTCSQIQNRAENSLEELEQITNIVNERVEKVTDTQQLIVETFKNAKEILTDIQISTETTITESQRITLQETFRVFNILSQNTNSGKAVDKSIECATRSIAQTHEEAINSLKTLTTNEEIFAVEYSTVESYNEIYNTMEEEVQRIFKTRSLLFMSSFSDTIQCSQENQKLSQMLNTAYKNNKRKQTSEKYKTLKSFLQSGIFSAKLGIIQEYNTVKVQNQGSANIQENELCVRNLDTLTAEVSKSVAEMGEMSKYVETTLKKGETIFKRIENNKTGEVALTKEDINILTECKGISEMILFTCNSFSQAEQDITFEAEKKITKLFETTINFVRNEQNEDKVHEMTTQCRQKYDTTCTHLQHKVIKLLEEQSEEITRSYKTISEHLRKNDNVPLQIILQDCQKSKTEKYQSETYLYFQSYLSSVSALSLISDWDSNIVEEEETVSEVKERSLKHLNKLTSKVNVFISETNNAFKYVNYITQKCKDIFINIESNSNAHLTQEHISVINESLKITEMIAVQKQKYIEREEYKNMQETLHNECKNVLQMIKNVESEDIAEDTVRSMVHSYDQKYQELHRKMKTTVKEKTSVFQTRINELKSNEKVYSMIKSEVNYDYEFETSSTMTTVVKIRNLLTSIDSSATARLTSEYLQWSTTLEDNDFKEKYARETENLSFYMKEQVTCITEIQISVQEIYTKSITIIEKLEKQETSELSVEEKRMLQEAWAISNIISSSYNTMRDADEMIFQNSETKINEQFDSALQTIKSVNTCEDVRNILNENSKTYRNTYIDFHEEIRSKFVDYSYEFTNVLDTVHINKEDILREIVDEQQENTITLSSKYDLFLSSVQLRSEVNTETIRELNFGNGDDKSVIVNNGVNQLKKVTADIQKKITNMSEVEKYVTETIHQSRNILQRKEKCTITEFTHTEIRIIRESIKIVEIIRYECDSTIETQDREFINLETNMETTYDSAISTVRMAENAECVEKIINETAQEYESSFKTLKNQITESITTHSTDFSDLYTRNLENLKGMRDNTKDNQLCDIDLLSQKIDEKMSVCVESEEYKKLSLYIEKQDILLNHITVENVNNDSENKDYHENGAQKLKLLVQHTKDQINDVYSTNKYVNVNLIKGKEILNEIEKRKTITHLTEEEYKTLAICRSITKKISHNTESEIVEENLHQSSQSLNEQNTIDENIEEEENHYQSSRSLNKQNTIKEEMITTVESSVEAEVDVNKMVEEVNKNYAKTVDVIKTSQDELEVEKAVETTVEKFDVVQQKKKELVKENLAKRIDSFATKINSSKEKKHEVIESLVNDIKQNKPCKPNEKLQKLEAFVKSDTFKKAGILKNKFKKLKENKPQIAVAVDDNVEDCRINNLEMVKQEMEIDIKEMDEIQEYVATSLREGEEILNEIETNADVQLTKEQREKLHENYTITELIKQEVSTTNIEELENKPVDSLERRNTMNKKCEEAVDLIKSTSDEKEVDNVVNDYTSKYENMYEETRQSTYKEVHTQSVEFKVVLEDAINNVQDEQVKQQLSEILQIEDDDDDDDDDDVKVFINKIQQETKQETSSIVTQIEQNNSVQREIDALTIQEDKKVDTNVVQEINKEHHQNTESVITEEENMIPRSINKTPNNEMINVDTIYNTKMEEKSNTVVEINKEYENVIPNEEEDIIMPRSINKKPNNEIVDVETTTEINQEKHIKVEEERTNVTDNIKKEHEMENNMSVINNDTTKIINQEINREQNVDTMAVNIQETRNIHNEEITVAEETKKEKEHVINQDINVNKEIKEHKANEVIQNEDNIVVAEERKEQSVINTDLNINREIKEEKANEIVQNNEITITQGTKKEKEIVINEDVNIDKEIKEHKVNEVVQNNEIAMTQETKKEEEIIINQDVNIDKEIKEHKVNEVVQNNEIAMTQETKKEEEIIINQDVNIDKEIKEHKVNEVVQNNEIAMTQETKNEEEIVINRDVNIDKEIKEHKVNEIIQNEENIVVAKETKDQSVINTDLNNNREIKEEKASEVNNEIAMTEEAKREEIDINEEMRINKENEDIHKYENRELKINETKEMNKEKKIETVQAISKKVNEDIKKIEKGKEHINNKLSESMQLIEKVKNNEKHTITLEELDQLKKSIKIVKKLEKIEKKVITFSETQVEQVDVMNTNDIEKPVEEETIYSSRSMNNIRKEEEKEEIIENKVNEIVTEQQNIQKDTTIQETTMEIENHELDMELNVEHKDEIQINQEIQMTEEKTEHHQSTMNIETETQIKYEDVESKPIPMPKEGSEIDNEKFSHSTCEISKEKTETIEKQINSHTETKPEIIQPIAQPEIDIRETEMNQHLSSSKTSQTNYEKVELENKVDIPEVNKDVPEETEVKETTEQIVQHQTTETSVTIQNEKEKEVETPNMSEICEHQNEETTSFMSRSIEQSKSKSMNEEMAVFNEEKKMCISTLPVERTFTQTIADFDILLKNKFDISISQQNKFPAVCRSLTWSDTKFQSEYYKSTVNELNEVLQITRELLDYQIQVELASVKLARETNELLSSTTICIRNLEKVFRRLSMIVYSEFSKFDTTKLPGILDSEFQQIHSVFSIMQDCQKSNLLDLIDQPFANEYCDSFEATKIIVHKKFEYLRSSLDTIMNNIDCFVLVSLSSF